MRQLQRLRRYSCHCHGSQKETRGWQVEKGYVSGEGDGGRLKLVVNPVF